MQKILAEIEAENFLEKQGFPIVKRKIAHSLEQATNYANSLGYPVVLKLASKQLIHKTDINAVKFPITKETLPQAYKELMKIKIKKQGVIVQKFIQGKPLLLGLKKDPTFNHVITLAYGDIFTEIIKDTSFRICPIAKKEAREMIQELKSYPILKGARKQKPIYFNLLQNLLVKLSKLPSKFPKIKELDINPLVINNKEAKIVDAIIVLS